MIIGDKKCASLPSNKPVATIDILRQEYELSMSIYPECKRVTEEQIQDIIVLSNNDGVLDTSTDPSLAIICYRTGFTKAMLAIGNEAFDGRIDIEVTQKQWSSIKLRQFREQVDNEYIFTVELNGVEVARRLTREGREPGKQGYRNVGVYVGWKSEYILDGMAAFVKDLVINGTGESVIMSHLLKSLHLNAK